MSEPEASGGEPVLNVAAALGADAGISVQSLAVYVPNKDRTGREIGNQRRWVLEALGLLGKIGGGATAMPPAEGVWLDEQGQFVWENPVIAYTYIKPAEFLANLPQLREFLHRMGRETNQGEVVFEFDDQLYRIRTLDSEGAKTNGQENH
jgi:hypothetical protein